MTLITTVRVERHGNHDHVSVWVRGGLAGVLKCPAGDGEAVAELLRDRAAPKDLDWALADDELSP